MKKHKEELELLKRDLEVEKKRKHYAEAEYKSFDAKKQEYKDQLAKQSLQIGTYKSDNKRELKEYKDNEEALIEYKTLSFKQSSKIKELREEIELMNKKFPQEVAKYTKEIEFLKADIDNRHSELEYKYQSRPGRDARHVRHVESEEQGVEAAEDTPSVDLGPEVRARTLLHRGDSERHAKGRRRLTQESGGRRDHHQETRRHQGSSPHGG